MSPPTPSTFWQLYKAELRSRGSWSAYQTNPPLWTQIAKDAAIAACDRLGLETSKEYFRLDVLGYDENRSARHDWNVRVAFEVENTADWKDELCKLSHIVADLCVLAAYEWHKGWSAKEALVEYLDTLGERVHRVPGRQWLFIFGPCGKDLSEPWTAYAFNDNRELISVDEGVLLRGADLNA
ncbi:MAG: hypothetical protein ACHRHE_13920 [Tepidisphaerales bacterium]